MRTVGYLDKMKPLEDTTSYTSADARLALTDDSGLKSGVSDPAFNIDYADDGKLAPLSKVVHRAALDLFETVTNDYTVGHFFADCINSPREFLSQAATELHIEIDWNDPALNARLVQVRDLIYYPRIAAMYFTDDRGPQYLPLRSPFQYYKIQEGSEAPKRCYFSHGAQTWLESLRDYLLAQSNASVTIAIRTNAGVQVTAGPDGAFIDKDDGQAAERFDLCVVTTHADDARALLRFTAAASSEGLRIQKS
ncbi:hypothetical protein CAI21_10875 [Alkalilimnicola ehrlichii]|uniref:Amine oxidase domain-containing protein n=2 Tax=Alkalilimnicola ehrlichii TaxID=351052 RepID=A0A3E0WTK1_9GAMM|nr:hypothetical protein CAI21_10875 [Alkalilimnicola ehrlichii]RFA36168.1 hypothetical protein CAL65_12030 [Alkalilimnicola ehrlichii]